MSFSLNFLSIFVHVSGSIRLITLIWVLLERSFPLAADEYRLCQFWSKLMMSVLSSGKNAKVRDRPLQLAQEANWVKN